MAAPPTPRSSSDRRLALLIALALAACGSRGRGGGRLVAETDEGRFPHERHRSIGCVDCHALGSVLRGKPARPGTSDHAPCDRRQCHQKEFLTKPGKLCKVCHERVDPATPGGSALAAYPPVVGRRALAARFSHKRHLDYGAMERAVGFHVSCRDCHAADPKTQKLRPPDHRVCARCHAPEAARRGSPVMSKCDGCHKARRQRPSRLRKFITGDLHFRHANHRVDRRGTLIACTECHDQSAGVVATGAHPKLRTAVCVACHDDTERTPRHMRMRVCEVCHSSRSRSFSSLAPRSHLPATERPADHTLAFRRDHSADARADSQRCAKCHTFMSGSSRDTCDECHQTMRPRNHTVLWREYEHGPASAARSDSCATCHTGGFCVACHRKPPRSRFPSATFVNGGHGALAVFSLRACTTCHVISEEAPRGCIGARCHMMRP